MRPVDLVVFDVDGTLVTSPSGRVVWQVLLDRYADGSVSSKRHAAYRAGHITYAEWVDLDLGDITRGGANRAGIEQEVRRELSLSPGAREVVHGLVRRGYVLAVVSGTLDVVLDVLFPDHPFRDVHANRLRFAGDGSVEGWTATPFDMEGKAEGVRQVARECGVPLERVAFVGDHTNDLWALRLAGLPIAYDPKDESVRSAAKVVLPAGRLDRLLELLP